MHALSHSLTHRAPPTTRTRIRWQPYTSTSCCSSSRSYLNTPPSTVSKIVSPTVGSPRELERPKQPFAPPSQTSKDGQIRDLQKNKYVIGLVDQAVKSLCDIWNPYDIPPVFLMSSRPNVEAASICDPKKVVSFTNPHLHHRNTQLPSPLTPLTQTSPGTPQSISPSIPAAYTHGQSVKTPDSGEVCRSNLVPMKSFVHEVLRRSRTSGGVLQTALCYLEAIRSKVPELVKQEQMGEGTQGEPLSWNRIIQADNETLTEMILDDNNVLNGGTGPISQDYDGMDTLRISDCTAQHYAAETKATSGAYFIDDVPRKPKVPSSPLPPLPPLPSPLLCPRRAFLASLILASKFTQDRCYSNRAWAKLSGLPPREIGRCERALGDALEWRLWVGKLPPGAANRAVVRSKSDGDLLIGSKASTPSGPRTSSNHAAVSATAFTDQVGQPGSMSGHDGARPQTSLRRQASLPLDVHLKASASSISRTRHEESVHVFSYYDPPPSMPCVTPPMLGSELTKTSSTSSTAFNGTQYVDCLRSSPSPPTPPLSFSPTSTDSSCDGDRTIQMSSFIDEPCNGNVSFVPCGEISLKTSPPIWGQYSIPTHAPLNPTSATGKLYGYNDGSAHHIVDTMCEYSQWPAS